MLIIEFEGPPSWSRNASEIGESTKCLWVGVEGLIVWGRRGRKNRETVYSDTSGKNCTAFVAFRTLGKILQLLFCNHSSSFN